MKKFIIIIVAVFLMFNVAMAQEQLFLKHDKNLNIGMGFLNHPVISATLDYGIIDDVFDYGTIGAGPYAGFGFSATHTYLHAGARGTFHYPLIEKIDTYVGLGVGFNLGIETKEKMIWHPNFVIGANFPINDDITLYGELGTGVSYLAFGFILYL
ncbi:MAG: hypothetical protein PF436_03820 [Prolixibacteraceae bacterium]|jgi:hypothetical protein|nr:hypothetical protein [Prolixibacteraceae bacterium]